MTCPDRSSDPREPGLDPTRLPELPQVDERGTEGFSLEIFQLVWMSWVTLSWILIPFETY